MTRYLVNPDVSCRREADGAALYNPDTDDLVAVNGVGYHVWQALARPATEPEIVAGLEAIYQEVPAGEVAADVSCFVAMLHGRGFVGRVLEAGDPLPAPRRPATNRAASENCAAPPAPEPPGPYYYHGRSMTDSFRPGDYLRIEPVAIGAVRPGDVVVYRGTHSDGEAGDVVHRVVAVTPAGLVTQGDNNLRPDREPVTPEKLLGRVTHLERDGQVRPVGAGRRGAIQARGRRGWRRLRQTGGRWLRAVGRPAYGWLRSSGLAARLWRPAITRLLVTDGDGPLVKYLSGRRTVARWRPGMAGLSCRRPYDLVIPQPERWEAAGG